MKKLGIIVVLLLLASSLLAQESEKNFPNISVTGKSQIIKTADKAEVHFVISTEDRSLEEAVKIGQGIIKSISNDLQSKLDIPKSAINSSLFKTGSGYTFLFGLKKYRTVIEASMLITDMGKLEEAIIILSKHNISKISSVKFLLDNEDKLFFDAQKQAINAAKNKAKMIADELGVSLNGIYTVEPAKNYIVRDEVSMNNILGFKKATKPSYANRPNPFNNIDDRRDIVIDSVMSGKVKIVAEYEVVFKVKNP